MEKFDVYCRVPVFMSMLLEERLQEFGFKDKANTILYMVERYIDNKTPGTCSLAVKKIFSYMPRHFDPIVIKAERCTIIFKMGQKKYNTLTRVIMENGFETRNYFIMALVSALVIAPPRFLRKLSDEFNETGIRSLERGKMDFTTYVSDLQYYFLKQSASEANLTVSGLLRLVMNLFFKVSDGESMLPVQLEDVALDILEMKGSTIKYFSRDVTVHLGITPDEEEKLYELVLKYRIPGAREFTRRIVLFLLKGYRLVVEPEEEPAGDEDIFNDVNFEYLAKRDYARSIYATK